VYWLGAGRVRARMGVWCDVLPLGLCLVVAALCVRARGVPGLFGWWRVVRWLGRHDGRVHDGLVSGLALAGRPWGRPAWDEMEAARDGARVCYTKRSASNTTTTTTTTTQGRQSNKPN
jgi:hypothetical protein